jgi:hypothetical protein
MSSLKLLGLLKGSLILFYVRNWQLVAQGRPPYYSTADKAILVLRVLIRPLYYNHVGKLDQAYDLPVLRFFLRFISN